MSGRDGQVNGQEMMGCVDSSRWARSEKLHAFIKVVHFRTLLWSFQDRTGREYQLDIIVLWSPRRRVIVKFKCRFYFYLAQKELNKSRYECTRDSKEHLPLGWTKISRRQRCRCVIGRPIATGRPLSIPATECLLLRPPMISSSLLWMASPDTMGLPCLRYYDHGVVDGRTGGADHYGLHI